MIRQFCDKDFTEVVELFVQLWDDRIVDKEKIQSIIKNDKSKVTCVCEHDHKVIGVIVYSIRSHLWAQAKVLEIEVLVIDKLMRNKGYGKKLIQHVEQTALSSGCKYIELNSAFRREGAHRFYCKNGYNKCAYVFDKVTGV